jgi:hypothetical protein
VERVELEELLQDVLVRQPDRLQQRGHRHLAAAVDAEEQEVLRIELEVEPRAAIRNHAGREEELAGRMRLAAVVLEEHARRAWSCETMTRSVPLMMNEPLSVMSGISPM